MNRFLPDTRYDRQIRLPEIGKAGQEKLAQAAVLLIGAGGLGCPAALYLTAAGIGRIGIADGDRVSPSNLNRQVLHTPADIGRQKTLSAEQSLKALNPGLQIDIFAHDLDRSGQIEHLIKNYDLVLDCTDNFKTRYRINKACIAQEKPWIYAAVSEFEGQAMTILPGRTACFACLYPDSRDAVGTVHAVLGVTSGIMGLIQAGEAVKYIVNMGTLLKNRLFFLDLLDMESRCLTVNRNKECPVCGHLNP